MPYIKKEDRPKIIGNLDHIVENIDNVGELNYTITRLVHLYLKKEGICYKNLSSITGVLNDVKIEFERRVVAKYEDEKIEQNGDIGVL